MSNFEVLRYMTSCKAFMEDVLGLTVKDFHQEWLNAMESHNNLCLLAPRGHGKAETLDSLLLTPKGWVRMGDIEVGDYVIGFDGKPTKVIAIHPQGKMQVYKVETSDGRICRCGEGHLWTVQTPSNTRDKLITKPVEDLRKNYKSSRFDKRNGKNYTEYRHFLPTVSPVEFEEKDLIIDPYVLGIWLGDGTSANGGYCTWDEEILEYIPYGYKSLKTPHRYRIKTLYQKLKKLNLLNNKHIPQDYLFGSVEQRTKLLQGLMDTDGNNQIDGHVFEFCNINKVLIDSVVSLIRSLGGTAKVSERYTKPSKNSTKKFHSYRITGKLPDGIIPFRLSRKRNQWKGSLKTRSPITKIEPDGYDECQCITVNNEDGLYITDDYMVTHNSTIIEGYVVWRILLNPKIRILIVSMNANKSEDMMNFIKSCLELERVTELFGEQKSPTWSRNKIRVKNSAGGIQHKEPTLQVLGVTSSQISSHYDMIILDDVQDRQNVATANRRKQIRDWYNTELLEMLEPGGKIINIACFPETEKVLMSDNSWKSIAKIKTNELVKTYSDNGFEDKRVIASIPQGKKLTYKLKTDRSETIATHDHPFYTYNKKDKLFTYKKLIDIDLENDFIVSSYKLSTNKTKFIDEYGEVNKEFMWLLGFMTGDGWVTRHPNKFDGYNSMRWVVCFSKGIDEILNNKVKDTINSLFGYRPSKEREDGVVIYYRSKFGRILENAGLKKGAKNKDIPDWVFNTPIEYREAFLRGLMDADGTCTKNDRWALHVSSKKLVEDVQNLSKISGFKSTNTYKRTNKVKPPNSPKEIEATSYYTTVHFDIKRNKDGRYKSILGNVNLPKDFRFERPKSISKYKELEVYDLSIEDNHNFICEGMVVHNTRWHEDDLHNYLSEKSMYKVLKYQAVDYEKKTSLWPERFTFEDLMLLRDEHIGKTAFAMQYQNDIVQTEDSPIDIEWVETAQKRWNPNKIPSGTERYIGVDLASKSEEGDFFSVTVIAKDNNKNFYVVENIRDKVSMSRQLEIIQSLYEKYMPKKIGIESNATQRIITDEWIDKTNLPIEPLKSSWVNDKWSRIQRLAVLLETNRIVINPDLQHLCEELIKFPRGTHDDTIDSLAFAVQVSGDQRDVDWNAVVNAVKAKKRNPYVMKI